MPVRFSVVWVGQVLIEARAHFVKRENSRQQRGVLHALIVLQAAMLLIQDRVNAPSATPANTPHRLGPQTIQHAPSVELAHIPQQVGPQQMQHASRVQQALILLWEARLSQTALATRATGGQLEGSARLVR